MAKTGGDLKAWLTGLDDVRLRELILIPGPLPYRARIPRRGGRPRLGRRELLSVRAWLSRAQMRDLKQIADAAADFSGHLLVRHGNHNAGTLREPDLDTLESVIVSLPPVLARLVLHSMLMEDETPRRTLAEQHWDRLLEAAERPGVDWAGGEDGGAHIHEAEEEAAEQAGEADADPRQRQDDMGVGVALEDASDVVVAAGPAEALLGLRSRAAELADALERAAERVTGGFDLPQGLFEQVAAWTVERSAVAGLIWEAGRNWSAEEGFSELEAVIEQLRDEEEQETARAYQLAMLQEQRQALLPLVDKAEQGGGGTYFESLRETLRTLDEEIAGRSPGTRTPSEELPPSASREATAGDEPQLEESPTPESSAGVVETPGPEAESGLTDVSFAAERAEAFPAAAASKAGAPVGAAPRPDAPHLADGTESPKAWEAEASGPSVVPVVAEAAAEAETPQEAEVSEQTCLPWHAPAAGDSACATASLVERLVGAGRFQEAYWMTVGSGEPVHRAECLAFADAAFACATPEDATPVMTRFAPDLERVQSDRSALVLAAVASVRAGLVVGWPNDLLLQTDPCSSLSAPWSQLLECAIDVLRRYHRVDPATLHLGDDAGPTLTRSGIAREAGQLKVELPKRKIGYARATQVQNLLMRAEQPLGFALEAVHGWASGKADASALDEAWQSFRRRDSSERIIEEADAAIRTPKQAKEPIEAKAKRSLLNRIEQVVNLLSRARALAAPEVEERSDTVTALSHALARVRGLDALPGVEGAALLCLRRWLEGVDRAPTSRTLGVIADDDADETSTEAGPGPLAFAGYAPGPLALLAAPDLPRTPDGAPDTAAPGFAQAVASLLDPVDIPTVVTAYAERGDLHLADALVEALEQGLVPAAAAGPEELPSGWRTQRDAQWARWSNIRSETHRVAAGLLAELRTQQSLDELAERELVGRLEQLVQPFPEGAFRSTVAEIRQLEEDLLGRVDAYVQRLRNQLDTLPLSEKDRKQITSLLEAGDTVTAEECLAVLRKGDALPEWSGADRGEDLDRFVARLEVVAPVKAGQQGFSALPWAEHYADGQPLTEGALAGLESWDALSKPSTRGAEWQKHVPAVLRLLGLEGRPPARDDSRQVRGILRLTAKLRASESVPGYVAELGSAATTYTVLVVSDELRGRSPLELLDRSDTGACIILYLYPLGLAGRRGMALHARTSAPQALVVDPAVFGWVAARSPRSFRAVQRVTLPWAGFNPYTPFVAGLVPPEVFYGRTREMATVIDPLGALFLYGGRQLGKSALLRKVEADFPSTPDRKAVYLDLKARGVGEAEPADRIWPVLATELKRVSVLGPKVSTAQSPDVLLEQVRRWLEENRERRVLVLADEADAFLTADSKAVRGSGGEGTFANVARLKGLMDSTDRRFKVVFAGLHQVQRFSRLSNVPLAHGGEELIGPLKPAEAQRLVVEPMAAFGYRFERPELVWRVLAATNYQACLVQIFCERLVTALRDKPLGSAQWPITVTEEDIRAVAGSAEVHRHIAERLRLTINLEDRYRVLALAIALRSQADGFHRGYDADELLSEAKRNWPEGFRRLTASDVKIYLEEMVGLGLLIQEADRRHYAVRSPNVVHMLGTRDDLELELEQTEFSLPYDYNPRFSRRLLGTDRSGVSRYSPLAEQQLYEATGPGLTLVCLTKAHGPELMVPAIRSYADARGLTVHPAAPDTLVDVLTRTTRDREPSVVVADLRYCGLETLRQALERLHQHTVGVKGKAPRSGIALIDPRAQEARWDERVARVLRPERWNADSLRAWPECPFDTPDKRGQLIAATGGWPILVERTVDLATRGGATLKAALETTRAQYSQEAVARDHLDRVELDRSMRDLLAAWVQYIEPGESCNHGDIAAVTGLGLDEVRRFTDRLANHGVLDDSEDGYALDLVTFRALNTVGHGS
ncbi:ATP-binding protein [Streptomyces sp. NPDC005132]|uniref:ATP-binding protein n=1 Tax=Streptomyces sp. NPDC005132 TaxID=3154294 RepID=UPI0033A144E9